MQRETIAITITKDHVKWADPHDSYATPVSIALEDWLGVVDVLVETGATWVTARNEEGDFVSFDLSREVMEALADWESGEPFPPMSIELRESLYLAPVEKAPPIPAHELVHLRRNDTRRTVLCSKVASRIKGRILDIDTRTKANVLETAGPKACPACVRAL